MAQRKIFGSPVEPYFSTHHSSLSSTLFEEVMENLKEESQQSPKSNSDVGKGAFKRDVAVELIFATSDNLGLPPNTKYLAAEMFNSFMTVHVHELYEHVKKSGQDKKQSGAEWRQILERVRGQLPLRAVTCCQVASKLTTHSKMVGARKARRLLGECNRRYSAASLAQSELRVLKALQFRLLFPTPLKYLEALLESIARTEPSLDVKVLHAMGLKVLDMYYIRRRVILHKLASVAETRASMRTPGTGAPVQPVENLMLIAGGIITAACYVVEPACVNKALVLLSQTSELPQEDLLDVATVLVELLVEGTTC